MLWVVFWVDFCARVVEREVKGRRWLEMHLR